MRIRNEIQENRDEVEKLKHRLEVLEKKLEIQNPPKPLPGKPEGMFLGF